MIHRLKTYILASFLVLSSLCYGEKGNPYAVLKSIRSELRGEAAFGILNHDRLVSDPAKALDHIEYIIKISEELDDKALVCTYYEIKAHYYSLEYDRINRESTLYHEEALTYAKRNNLTFEEMRQSIEFGRYYNTYAKMGQAYHYFRESLNLLEKLNKQSIPNIWRYYHILGRYFYAIEKYDLSLDLLNSMLSDYHFNLKSRERFDVMNTIGLAYLYKGDYVESMNYFNQVYKKSLEVLDSAWMGIAKGNIGNVHMLEGRYNEAVKYFQIDYTYNMSPSGDLMSALSSLKKIAQIQYNLGGYEEALRSISEYLEKMEVKPARYRDLIEAYQLRHDIYVKLRLTDEQFHDLKEINKFTKLYTPLENEYSIEQQRLKIEQEKYEDFRSTSAKKLQLLRIVVAILSLIIIVLLSVYVRYRQKIAMTMSEKTVSGGGDNHRTMDATGMCIDTANYSNEEEDDVETILYAEEKVTQLAHSNLINRRKWAEFKVWFEKIHPGYFESLQKQYPHITESDCRLLALMELKLTNKEIAGALSISVDGVKKAKQRLKKKCFS